MKHFRFLASAFFFLATLSACTPVEKPVVPETPAKESDGNNPEEGKTPAVEEDPSEKLEKCAYKVFYLAFPNKVGQGIDVTNKTSPIYKITEGDLVVYNIFNFGTLNFSDIEEYLFSLIPEKSTEIEGHSKNGGGLYEKFMENDGVVYDLNAMDYFEGHVSFSVTLFIKSQLNLYTEYIKTNLIN